MANDVQQVIAHPIHPSTALYIGNSGMGEYSTTEKHRPQCFGGEVGIHRSRLVDLRSRYRLESGSARVLRSPSSSGIKSRLDQSRVLPHSSHTSRRNRPRSSSGVGASATRMACLPGWRHELMVSPKVRSVSFAVAHRSRLELSVLRGIACSSALKLGWNAWANSLWNRLLTRRNFSTRSPKLSVSSFSTRANALLTADSSSSCSRVTNCPLLAMWPDSHAFARELSVAKTPGGH